MFARAFLLVLFAAVCPAALADEAPPRPPNIVYVLADEWGYYELSCLGHPNIRTPVIDRLAKNGVRFTHAFAGAPVCAPTRASLMTGKHLGHTSVRVNGGGTPLRADEVTVASILSKAGYATGGFGKWGCGGRGSTGVPEKQGFDVFLGYYDQVHAHTYYPAYLVRNSEEVPLPGNRGGREGKTYAHYVIVEEAKKFIRANRERPFFCYLPVTPPHGMFDLPDDDPALAVYAEKDWPREAKRYAAMVTMLDRQVGEILELLEELGLAKNTLVLVGGDNGGDDYFPDAEHPRGFHAPNVDPKTGVEFRGHKRQLHDGGLRVPMIAYWPGRIEPGRVSDHRWYFPDFLPTFAELAGAEVPGDIDGISIVPELFGAAAAGREQGEHEYLYWEFMGQTAVRAGPWKLIRMKPEAAWELYAIDEDVSESEDVAAKHPEVVEKLACYATAAHEPAVEGTFADTADHEKDRRARGDTSAPRGPVQNLPKKGLISRNGWKVLRASSESTGNGRLAKHVLDGDPKTFWHSRWMKDLARPPHELLIDMGSSRTVRGFVYLARQDGGWNGAFGKCEFRVGDDPAKLGEVDPTATAQFTKSRGPQRVECEPTSGRYLLVRILSEAGGGPWASMAELGVIGE